MLFFTPNGGAKHTMASGIGMWEMEAPSEESKLEPRDTSNVCCGVLASFPMRIDDFPSGERAI